MRKHVILTVTPLGPVRRKVQKKKKPLSLHTFKESRFVKMENIKMKRDRLNGDIAEHIPALIDKPVREPTGKWPVIFSKKDSLTA